MEAKSCYFQVQEQEKKLAFEVFSGTFPQGRSAERERTDLGKAARERQTFDPNIRACWSYDVHSLFHSNWKKVFPMTVPRQRRDDTPR